jgi:hypothetical protein
MSYSICHNEVYSALLLNRRLEFDLNVIGPAYSMHWSDEKCIQNFYWNPEQIRPLVRHRHRWAGNIRWDLGEIGWKS